MNILVIEDNRQEMALLRAALSDITSATVRMEHADRLSTALSSLTVGRFDAMLLDLNLPDSAGLDTLARVQARAPALPIVILTGPDDEPLALLAVQQGAQDYVFKGQYEGSVVHRSLRCAVERNRLVTDLEARVAARTAELAGTTQVLQRAMTERTRREETAREREERFRALYDATPFMYFTVSQEGTVLSVNSFGATQLGYTQEELLGHSVLEVFYEEDKDAVARNLAGAFSNPSRIAQWTFRKVKKDGTVIWVSETVRIAHGAEAPIALIACEDITARKLAEKKRGEQELLTTLMLNTGPSCIIRVAPNGTLLQMNPAGLRLIDACGEQDALGLSVFDLILPEHRAAFVSMHHDVIDGHERTLQFEIQGLKGSRRWMETYAVPFRNPVTECT